MKKTENKNTESVLVMEEKINKSISRCKAFYLLTILILSVVCVALAYLYVIPQVELQSRIILAGVTFIPYLVIMYILSKIYKKKMDKYDMDLKRLG